LSAEVVLQRRTWKDVKYFVYSLLKKANRKLPFIGVDRKLASKLDSRLTDVCSWH